MKSTHDILIASGYELLPNGRYKKANPNVQELSPLEKEVNTIHVTIQKAPKPGKISVKKIQRAVDSVSHRMRSITD